MSHDAPRRLVDPRTTLPIAVVVDSGGNPVGPDGRPVLLPGGGRLLLDAEGRFVDGVGEIVDPTGTGIVGIYRQETGRVYSNRPGEAKGRNVLWFSDEPGGEAGVYQSKEHRDPTTGKRLDLRPPHLRGFQTSAMTGELSAAYRLTDWGRLVAKTCKCTSGGGLREAPRPNADKRADRGGMNSEQWKKHKRALELERLADESRAAAPVQTQEPEPTPAPQPPPRWSLADDPDARSAFAPVAGQAAPRRPAANRRPTRVGGVDYPSRTAAAAELGVSRGTVLRMMKREKKGQVQ